MSHKLELNNNYPDFKDILLNIKSIFSLLDINRMKFRPINNYEGLENFNKLWFNEEDLTTIAKKYSKLALLDETKAISEILMHDKKLKDKVLLKRKLKGKTGR